MRFNDVSFPHPVLGVDDGIKGNIRLNPEPLITAKEDYYLVNVDCEHDNEELNELVRTGTAEYFLEATCSNTLYRTAVKSSANQLELRIPKKHVREKVTFTCLLLAKSTIENYSNRKFHGDYSRYTFEIEAGDVLALFGEFSFNAEINYEKLKAVSSFMEVVENRDDSAVYTNVDLNKSKIEVQLPSDDYKLFADDSISKEQKFAPIFHSSIVLNALLMALYNFDDYKKNLWAQVIKYRLENEDLFKNISIEDKENIPEIAQRLLGNPFKRLISELNTIVDSKNSIGED